MPLDADGWAKIITATLGGVKDLLLAIGVILGVMYGASNGTKLDKAADRTEEVKKALDASTEDRDQHFAALSSKVEAVKTDVAKVVDAAVPK